MEAREHGSFDAQSILEPRTARPSESGRRRRRQGAAGTGKERRRCDRRWGARLTSCSLPADVATSSVCLGDKSYLLFLYFIFIFITYYYF